MGANLAPTDEQVNGMARLSDQVRSHQSHQGQASVVEVRVRTRTFWGPQTISTSNETCRLAFPDRDTEHP